MDYVMAAQAPAYRLSESSFATESAFAEHLMELRALTKTRLENLVLLSSEMTDAEYAKGQSHMRVIDSTLDRIWFAPTHRSGVKTARFIVDLPWRLLQNIRRIRRASLVHADLAYDVRRPMPFILALVALLCRRPVVFVVDTDFRLHAQRYRAVGTWSRGQYLVNQHIYIPIRKAQVRFAARYFQLVLLKSAALVKDFGRSRENVRAFYDTVHGLEQVIEDIELDHKVLRALNPTHSLRLCYFGRLVSYKGVDRMIEAVQILRDRGRVVELEIIGDGPEREGLAQQVEDLGLADQVKLTAQVAYGAELFARLGDKDVAIAAPLVEDTPRAAFDAFARGLPIVAFDVSYFKDLAEESDAVALATWPSAESLAAAIARLDSDRVVLSEMINSAVNFARANTQEIWLSKRLRWTLAVAIAT